jgi:hypothetical protein
MLEQLLARDEGKTLEFKETSQPIPGNSANSDCQLTFQDGFFLQDLQKN